MLISSCVRTIAATFVVASLLCCQAWAGAPVDPGPPSGGDDTPTLQAILNQGNIVSLRSGATYTITRRLDVLHDGSGIKTASGAPATIRMSNTFNNFDPITMFRASVRSDSIGIRVSQADGVALQNFRIEKVHIDGTWVAAIWLERVNDSIIEDVEMWGFSLGPVIALDSVARVNVRGCVIRDSWASHVHADYRTRMPQLSGIVLDDNRAGVETPIDSEDVSIVGNIIRNLRFKQSLYGMQRSVFGGSPPQEVVGYQTDGVNVNGDAKRVRVVGNVIDTVGEGVDAFGVNGLVADNEIRNAYYFGVKLIHGAANNTVRTNTIGAAGLASVTVSGGDGLTFGNLVWGNIIAEVGGLGAFCSSQVPAAFRITTCLTGSAQAFLVQNHVGDVGDPTLSVFTGNYVAATGSDARMNYFAVVEGPVAHSLFFGNPFLNISGRTIGNLFDGLATGTEIDSAANRFALADVDANGIDDFFVHWSASGANRLYRRNSLSSFTSRVNAIGPNSVNGHSDNLMSGDFNGDGRDDLMFHWKGDGTNRVYLATGVDSFTEVANPIETTLVNGNPDRVRTGDFNGDGRDDLMFYWSAPGTNRFAYATAAGGFSVYTNPIAAGAINGSPENVLLGDFDGDSRTDVGFHWVASGTNRFYYGGASAGSFVQKLDPIPATMINEYPDRTFVLKADTDARDDAGFMWLASDLIRIYLGQNNRTFVAY